MNNNKESTPLLRQQQLLEQDQLDFTPQQLKLLKQILLQQGSTPPPVWQACCSET